MKFDLNLNFILFITVIMSYTSAAQDTCVIEGEVNILYVEDTLGYDRFWLREKTFGGLYFEEDALSFLVKLDLICEGRLDIHIPDSAVRLYDLPEYQLQEREDKNYYVHSGGELFKKANGDVLITFHMKAKVLKVKKASICDKFRLQSEYTCPVEKVSTAYPIYVILDVLSARAFDANYLSDKDFEPFKDKSFPLGVCD